MPAASITGAGGVAGEMAAAAALLAMRWCRTAASYQEVATSSPEAPAGSSAANHKGSPGYSPSSRARVAQQPLQSRRGEGVARAEPAVGREECRQPRLVFDQQHGVVQEAAGQFRRQLRVREVGGGVGDDARDGGALRQVEQRGSRQGRGILDPERQVVARAARERPAQEQPATYFELFFPGLKMFLCQEHGAPARGYACGHRRGTGETAVEVYRCTRRRGREGDQRAVETQTGIYRHQEQQRQERGTVEQGEIDAGSYAGDRPQANRVVRWRGVVQRPVALVCHGRRA